MLWDSIVIWKRIFETCFELANTSRCNAQIYYLTFSPFSIFVSFKWKNFRSNVSIIVLKTDFQPPCFLFFFLSTFFHLGKTINFLWGRAIGVICFDFFYSLIKGSGIGVNSNMHYKSKTKTTQTKFCKITAFQDSMSNFDVSLRWMKSEKNKVKKLSNLLNYIVYEW